MITIKEVKNGFVWEISRRSDGTVICISDWIFGTFWECVDDLFNLAEDIDNNRIRYCPEKDSENSEDYYLEEQRGMFFTLLYTNLQDAIGDFNEAVFTVSSFAYRVKDGRYAR